MSVLEKREQTDKEMDMKTNKYHPFIERNTLYGGDKWRLLGWTLIHIAWSPSKKRTFGHRHKERDNSVKTQREDHHL